MSASEDPTLHEGAVIDAVSVVPLEPQPERAETVLPFWAAPAAVGRSQDWPENRERWAVQVSANGETGTWGPCSAATTAIIRDQFAALLIGKPVAPWRWFDTLIGHGRLRAGAHYRHAKSVLELALWDLRSRTAGRAVTDLLGGALRGTVPAYASALGIDIDHPLAPDIARWLAEAGFWGQKWALPGSRRGETPARDAARLARLREAVGPETRLMVDTIVDWPVPYAAQMAPVCAEAGLTWIEGGPGLSAALADRPVPGLVVAGGEYASAPDAQIAAITGGTLSVWQPDLAWHGGLAPVLRGIELAAAAGLWSFPHASSLPAALHAAAVFDADQVPAVEYHLTLDPARHRGLRQIPVPASGAFTVHADPGLTSGFITAGPSVSLAAKGSSTCALTT